MLAAFRKKAGLSQRALGESLGYKKQNGQFISNIERGLCSIPAEKIEDLAQKLSISKNVIIEVMVIDYESNLRGL